MAVWLSRVGQSQRRMMPVDESDDVLQLELTLSQLLVDLDLFEVRSFPILSAGVPLDQQHHNNNMLTQTHSDLDVHTSHSNLFLLMKLAPRISNVSSQHQQHKRRHVEPDSHYSSIL